MSVEERRAARARDLEREEDALDADAGVEEDEDLQVSGFQALLQDRKKLATGFAIFVVAIVAIYVLFPKIVGFDDALARIDDANWVWIAVAIGFNGVAFGAYVALFRGIIGGTARRDDELHRRLDWRASYQITMAGLAATRIFSAGGAGGIVLTYWALRKAGMPRRRAACRMVAFLVLMYSVYPTALILFGVLLRTHVLPGPAPIAGTIVPAGIAAGLIVLTTLVSLIPEDVERRLEWLASRPRTALPGSPQCRPRSQRASERRGTTSGTLGGGRWGCPERSASGRPTSPSSGRASRRSEARCSSPCWYRASSSGWPPI
jgi:uncharacterized membrane protein YbhN (UPF0104 family)